MPGLQLSNSHQQTGLPSPGFLAAISFCLIAIFGSQKAAAMSTSSSIQPALEAWIAGKPGGIAVAYVEGGKTTFFQAGHFSATDSRPVGPDTVFEIGSVTKVFTALLLEDSVRAGKIKMDEPIGVPFSPSRITYRQLATHTSGLPRLPKELSSFAIMLDVVSTSSLNPYRNQTLEKLKASFDEAKGSARESAFSYSNFGYAVLGQAMAGAWGKPFEQLMAERILQPAALTDTKSSWREADPHRLAPGHTKGGRPADNWDQASFAPAGALVSTTRDLAKFLQMCTGALPSPWGDSLNEISRPVVDVPKLHVKAGLAWIITMSNGQTIVWHNGGTGGYRSFIGFDPGRKKGVVVLTNHAQPIDDIGFAVLRGSLKPEEAPAGR